jgi:hypothetical protein
MPTCPGTLSPSIVTVHGATHSVCPYPSTTKQPIAARTNVSTFSDNGAEPVIINFTRPPMPSRTRLNTIASHIELLRMIPLEEWNRFVPRITEWNNDY